MGSTGTSDFDSGLMLLDGLAAGFCQSLVG